MGHPSHIENGGIGVAANGNEALTIGQLKQVYKIADDTSYGVVKLVSDEDLLSMLGTGASDKTFQITKSTNSGLDIDTVSLTGKCSDGEVTISGTISFGTAETLSANMDYVVASFPTEYAPPQSTIESTCSLKANYNTYNATVKVTPQGYIQIHTSSFMPYIHEVTEISVSYSISQSGSSGELPEGTYAITVQQLKMLIDNGSGGGSGGSGGSGGGGGGVDPSGGTILYQGTTLPTVAGYPISVEFDPYRLTRVVATMRVNSGMQQVEFSDFMRTYGGVMATSADQKYMIQIIDSGGYTFNIQATSGSGDSIYCTKLVGYTE